MLRVVLDTNVLVTGLRSRRGASFRLLSLLGSGRFEIAVSVGLVLEYEDAMGRQLGGSPLTVDNLDDFLDYVCTVAHRQEIFYLWRPVLPDAKDDMVLEVAVASGARTIVTFNERDFSGAARFGVRVVSPREFLGEIR